ncbi:hypothetical protein DFJ43DRAFT_796314 [Lentinula guzmanii]|uniref:Uncharacterized protein n=1 Tax=Lentinula guzmanii TaxID=2804957 RepID=A0AA38MVN0_9AGAR|nr:hypothetical protein DFJ43DRAFT_796314 [Lentinula guzmanii]
MLHPEFLAFAKAMWRSKVLWTIMLFERAMAGTYLRSMADQPISTMAVLGILTAKEAPVRLASSGAQFITITLPSKRRNVPGSRTSMIRQSTKTKTTRVAM